MSYEPRARGKPCDTVFCFPPHCCQTDNGSLGGGEENCEGSQRCVADEPTLAGQKPSPTRYLWLVAH